MKKEPFLILSTTATLLICALVVFKVFAQDTEISALPGAPTNLIAIPVSDNEIRLSWESSDDQENLSYDISRDDTLIATSVESTYTDTGLRRNTLYTYKIVASNGVNFSKPATYRLATLDQGDSIAPTAKPPVPEAGDGISPNPTRPGTNPSDDEGGGVVSSPVSPPGYTRLVFNDDFDGSGALDVTSASRNWRFETMDDGLHRAGNTGIDANGNLISEFNSVRGKRWSAWYDDMNNVNTYRSNGVLVMQGTDSGQLDSTRPVDYLDNGARTTYGASKLYTSWIDTFSRVFDVNLGAHVKDPNSPGKSFRYGYVEASVSFEQMNTPGFRLSLWLLPASSDAEGTQLLMSQAYDADGNNGVEIDIFEYEWINTDNANRIQTALIGGAAGSQNVSIDVSTLPAPVNLSQGFHTVSLLWEEDILEWKINDQTIQTVTDVDLIPDIYSYVIISREMNSGVKRPGVDSTISSDMLELQPFVPRDPGLFANNIWEYKERLVTDKALVDYIRVWQKP